MMTRILRGGTVIDGRSVPQVADVVLSDDLVTAVLPAGQVRQRGAAVTDVTGCLITPGLVDIQVHFREPGGTEAEDIGSGAQAAARGGVAAVVMMPNTTPPIDTPDMVREVRSLGRRALVDVHTAAALTIDRAGERLVDFDRLYQAGVRIFTDDGSALMHSGLMRQALEATTRLAGMVVSQHAEDAALVAGGAINEGAVAHRLGVQGRPPEAEEIIVARDLILARSTGGRYHVLHLSTGAALELVSQARGRGVDVSCEVTPQHLVLTEEDVARLGTVGKMNPPLRTAADVTALRVGVAGGTVDAIATDHAPHSPARKSLPLDQAPPGMLGVETAATVVWTHLVGPGLLTPQQAITLLSVRPARIAGLSRHGGPVAPGRPANLCVFDPEEQWRVDATSLASRSANTPFDGEPMTGRPVLTVVDGRAVMSRL